MDKVHRDGRQEQEREGRGNLRERGVFGPSIGIGMIGTGKFEEARRSFASH